MRNAVIGCVCVAVVLFILPWTALAQAEKEASLDTVTFITDFDSPPSSFRRGSAPDGFDIDLATALARELGAKLLWKEMMFDPEVYAKGFDTAIADAAIASITITKNRRKIMAFTRPYFICGQAIAVREKAEWKGGDVSEALKGKRLGAMDLTTGAAYAKENLKGAELEVYHTQDSLARALKAGWVDAIILDEHLMKYLASLHSFRFRVVGRDLTHEEYGIAVSKKNQDLLRRLNTALKKVEESGEYAKIYEKWFGHKANLPK